MHEELEQLRAEKVTSAAEKQDLKRRIQKVEAERRELEAQRARLERERAALKQHIETVTFPHPLCPYIHFVVLSM